MIEIKENLFAIEVPTDSAMLDVRGDKIQYCIPSKNLVENIPITNGSDYKIVGFVDVNDITFDCTPYVEHEIDTANNNEVYWANYLKPPTEDFYFEVGGKELSFRLLLQSKGIYFFNPMGECPVYSEYVPSYLDDNFNKRNKIEEYETDISLWNEMEE